jgi:2,3-bisphosphoglycerate-dependent phosphoglycerate mutase
MSADHRLELWLVRHGETTHSRDGMLAGWGDVPLTEVGEEQATAVRPLLAGERFAGVWSSDLSRARRTAALAWGDATPDRRLREINFGELEGQAWATLDDSLKQALVHFAGFNPPGGETIEVMRARIHSFLDELPPGRHLLFTHGGVIRALTREVGEDAFQPTGTVVALDWSARTMIFVRKQNGARSPFDDPSRRR